MLYYEKPEPIRVQGTCTVPGCTNKQKNKGNGRYMAVCYKHALNGRPRSEVNASYKEQNGWEPYQRHRKGYCERCGPNVKYYRCQLDVHHIDEDHSNNDPINLLTWCSNCHRLYHWLKQRGRLDEF
jgi:hypothetical protein